MWVTLNAPTVMYVSYFKENGPVSTHASVTAEKKKRSLILLRMSFTVTMGGLVLQTSYIAGHSQSLNVGARTSTQRFYCFGY